MRARVLVVDDEPAICRALVRELGREFDVVVASDAREAMALWSTTDPPSAVVTDLAMGDGPDGIALLTEIKRLGPTVARILVSATCEPARAQRALDEEILHEFIAKPWAADEVRTAVRRWLHTLEADVRRSGALAINRDDVRGVNPATSKPRRSSG